MRPDTDARDPQLAESVLQEDGLVTAGQRIRYLDGGAATVLASEEYGGGRSHGLKPLGRLVAWPWQASSQIHGIGSAPAARKALEKAKMKLEPEWISSK